MVKSACGIEAVYMCFNGTGIWGGETISAVPGVCMQLLLANTRHSPNTGLMFVGIDTLQTFIQLWASGEDVGLALKRHWVNVFCLLGPVWGTYITSRFRAIVYLRPKGANIQSPGEGGGGWTGVFVADKFFIPTRLGGALKILNFIVCL